MSVRMKEIMTMYKSAVFFAGSLAVFVAIAGVTSARAADIYAPSAGSLKDPVVQEQVILPEAEIYQEYAEWYVRADFGIGRFGHMDENAEASGTSFAVDGLDIDNLYSGSVGFGRYVTPNVRLGLDLDYRHDASSTFNTGDPAAVQALTNLGSIPLELSSTSVMLNAVYDFAPGRRFSPYIGGGIGWVFHNLELKGSSFSNDLNGDATMETASISTSESNSSSFAANVVTGVSVGLRQGLFLDVGYRFSYLGDADMNFDYSHPGSPPAMALPENGSGSIGLDDIMTHEFRIGLRYDLY